MALVCICIMDSEMGQIGISRLELQHLIMHMCTEFLGTGSGLGLQVERKLDG